MSNTVLFILGLLSLNSILLLWFFSPIKTSISEIFLKKSLMPLDFDDYIYSKNKIIGKLISCYICCSFWISLIIGIVFTLLFNLPITWPLITFFCYPGLSYLFFTFIKR